MDQTEEFMKSAIKEAEKGRYQTWKEPLVGCIIVKDGKQISSGFQEKFSAKHAAIVAIEKLNSKQLQGSSLYLTMEPCDDCTKEIVKAGFAHVFIAENDPRPDHSSKNATAIALKSKNTKVTAGVLTQQAKELNKHYVYFCQEKKPWITIKQNLSLDHKVGPANGKYIKLTNEEVRNYIHHERADYQAIIIGSSTAIIDNPNLMTDVETDHRPLHVIIDRRGRLINNQGLNLLNNNEYETWIMTQNANVSDLDLNPNVKVFQLKTDGLKEIIDLLSKHGIQSIYIEGGPTIEKAFMDEAYVNEIVDYFSPVYFGSIGLDGAVPVHQFDLDHISVKQIDDHIRIAGLVK